MAAFYACFARATTVLSSRRRSAAPELLKDPGGGCHEDSGGTSRGARAARRCVVPAFAQFDRGSISGTIKDEQGGVMPGVTVTVTNTQTRQSQTTSPMAQASYTFPNLLPGSYDILAELPGFKKVSRQNVTIDAAGAHQPRLHAADRNDQRGSDRGRRVAAAPDRRRDQKDRGSEGHRAAFVRRPQPDRRGRPEGWRHGGNFNSRRLLRFRQRRLQHQRQPHQTKTTSPSTAPSPSARARRARLSASRTSTRSRKCRC